MAKNLPSFAHELTADKHGFAFGGVDPGTLHAHGKLVKVHAVHYSIGLAGRYKLHVGLRQQMQPLPGSPFDLVVEPGHAYAASSKLPVASLPLSGVASEEWQHGLIFHTKDMLGNVCNKGGATILVKLSKAPKAVKDAEGNAIVQSVTFSTNDRGDGTYELSGSATRRAPTQSTCLCRARTSRARRSSSSRTRPSRRSRRWR